jgi:hypothetical protein
VLRESSFEGVTRFDDVVVDGDDDVVERTRFGIGKEGDRSVAAEADSPVSS